MASKAVGGGQQVDELFWLLSANTQPLVGGVGKAQGVLGRFAAFMKTPIGALTALGAAALIAGVQATKMAAQFDKALREVSTILPVTVDQMGDLRDEIVALSEDVPEPPPQLTKGLYQVISAGIDDTAKAMFVLEASSKAAVAGLSDSLTAVNAVTTVLNAYQMEASAATSVTDVFFATVKEGKTTFPELAADIGNVATTAALAGVSFEEVGAAIATMTKFGVGTTEATTSINRLLLSTVNNSKDAQDAAKAMGVDFSATALRTKGLAGFLRDMAEGTEGAFEALAKINPNVRSFKAAVILAGAGAEEFERILGEMENSGGAAERAFQKMNGALDNQWLLLKNKVNAIWLKLGNVTLPIVLGVLQSINRLMESDIERQIRLLEELGLAVEATELKRQEVLKSSSEELGSLNKQIEEAGLMAATGTDISRFQLRARGDLEEFERRSDRFIQSRVLRQFELNRLLENAKNQSGAELEVTNRKILALREIDRLQDQRVKVSERIIDLQETVVEGLVEEGDEVENVVALTDDILEKREALREAAEAFTLGLTQTQVDDMTAGLVEFRDAVLEAFGEIPEFFAGVIQEMESEIQRVGVLEEMEEVVDGVERQLEDFGDQAEKTTDQIDQMVMVVREAVEALEEDASSMREGSRERREADSQIRKLTRTLKGLLKARDALVKKKADDLTDVLEDENREMENQIQNAVRLSRAVLDLAQAFGIASDDGSRLVGSLINIGDGIAQIATGNIGTGVVGIIGGIANAVGALFGGGVSEEEEKRLKVLESNNESLRRLTDSIDSMNQSLAVATEARVLEGGAGAVQAALERSGFLSGGPIVPLIGAFLPLLEEELAKLGLTIDDLRAFAAEAEIELDDSVESWEQLGIALREVDIETALEGFTNQLGLLRREFALFDTKPVDQVQDMLDVLREFTELEIPEFDLVTAEGRKSLEEFLQEAFLRVTGGDLAGLGQLSFSKFLDLIGDIEGTLDGLMADDPGESEEFRVTRGVTEVTGSLLVSLMTTSAFWNEQTARTNAEILRSIQGEGFLGLRPPLEQEMAALMAGMSGGGFGDVILNVEQFGPAEITVVAPDAVTAAELVKQDMVEGIDIALRESLERVNRQFGESRIEDA